MVTALHECAPGEVWPATDVEARKSLIEASGLTWDVCESIWMPDAIKLKGREAQTEVTAWIGTMRNLARAGVKTTCYDFMPLLDWTRTDLAFDLPGQGQALRFEMVDFVIYDVHILARENAVADHAPDLCSAAESRWRTMSEDAQAQLECNIVAGLPGSAKGFARADLAAGIDSFAALSHTDLRANLASFLSAVVPEAEALGVRLAIHPDDPPFPLFGLPRCVSTADDLTFVLASQPSPANGLTFCTGSLGARVDNDLPAMARRFGDGVFFAHVRNVLREADGSFFEAAVLEDDTDMLGVLAALCEVERSDPGREIPMRPDHGHLLEFERNEKTNPGYSYLGRAKGLAELRGAMAALSAISYLALETKDRSST